MSITPVLFPYTTIAARHREAARRFFPSLTVLRPLGTETPDTDDAESLRIVAHAAACDRREELVERIAAYRRWALQHPGTDLAAWAGRGPEVPFFDETSVARIRTEIRRGDTGRGTQDPLFDCRLFLGIAEAFDRQTMEAAGQLENLEKAESRMLGALRGKQTPPRRHHARRPSETEALLYMPARRIRAWAGLYLAAPPPKAIFITLTSEIIDQLAETAGTEELQHVGTVRPPVSRTALMGRLAALAAGGGSAEEGFPEDGDEARAADASPLRLALYRIADRRAEAFFAALAPRGIEPQPAPESFRNTLIGLLAG